MSFFISVTKDIDKFFVLSGQALTSLLLVAEPLKK